MLLHVVYAALLVLGVLLLLVFYRVLNRPRRPRGCDLHTLDMVTAIYVGMRHTLHHRPPLKLYPDGVYRLPVATVLDILTHCPPDSSTHESTIAIAIDKWAASK